MIRMQLMIGITQGLHHDLDFGGRDRYLHWGDGAATRYPIYPPNFGCSSDFGQFFAKRLANLLLQKIFKKNKIVKYWMGLSHRPQDWEVQPMGSREGHLSNPFFVNNS